MNLMSLGSVFAVGDAAPADPVQAFLHTKWGFFICAVVGSLLAEIAPLMARYNGATTRERKRIFAAVCDWFYLFGRLFVALATGFVAMTDIVSSPVTAVVFGASGLGVLNMIAGGRAREPDSSSEETGTGTPGSQPTTPTNPPTQLE